MQKSSLTELQTEYASGKLDRKLLEGMIFQYLLDNYEKYRLFNGNRDKWIDFIGWFYPRMSRAVDLYRDTGSTFDAYISAILKWASKEYKAKEAEHKTTELACWKARAEEMELCSPEPDYYTDLCGGPDDGELWTSRTKTRIFFPLMNMSKRQILILLLKSYYFIDQNLLNKVSKTVGMGINELQAMIDKLHEIRAKKEDYIHTSRERIHSQYYRCLAFQQRLATALPGTARYQKLINYTERAKLKYKTMKKRFGKIHIDATNQQIADVLNIPKGTVDSALHYLKERWTMTVNQPAVKVPLAQGFERMYDEECSATAMVSMQAVPQMS